MATKNTPGFGWYIFLAIFSPLAIIGGFHTVQRTIATPKTVLWLAVGIVLFFFLSHILKQRKSRRGDYSVDHFLATFSHEFTHTVVSWLFLKRVHSFNVTASQGGEIMHTSGGKVADTCISLAPYCLPVFTYALLIIRSCLRTEILPFCDVLLGITVAFHARCFASQTKWDQPDINHFGNILFPYWYIVTALVFNLSILLLTLMPGNNILLAFRDIFVDYFSIVKSLFGMN